MTTTGGEGPNLGDQPPDLGPRNPDEIQILIREKEDRQLHRLTTIPVDLPEPIVEAINKHGLKIKITNSILAKILPDQGSEMMSTDGCISSPGGPSC